MALIALVIKRYNELFKEEIFNFSDEFKVDFNFETNELKIDKNPDYIKNFYGESIYNISPIVGINGIGKTTVLNIISGYSPDKFDQDPDNQYFFLFEIGKHENKVRFKVSLQNLSVANLSEYGESPFYRNQDGSFELDSGYYDGTQNILYVNLLNRGRGTLRYRTTLNQMGLARFIHSYLWLSDRNIISSVLSCSLEIESYGLKPMSREIKAIEFLIYKSIYNIFYDEVKLIKKFLSEPLLSKCENYLEENVSNHEDSGFNLLLDIVKELDKNEVKDETRKIIKEYVESIIDIVNIFREIRDNGSLIDNKYSSILLKYINNNRSLFEKLNDKLLRYTKSKELVNDRYISLKKYNNDYVLNETPDYHMSTGEGNLIEIFSRVYSYLLMYEKNAEDIILIVDELETGMHLEWSRRLINILIKNLSEILETEGMENKIQLIFTTHSPYMLSDIKPGNVIMLEKNQETGYSEGKVLQNTFAKNIQEIMKENLIDNIYGDFALAKINSMISRLNGEEGDEEELLKEIHLISEPILRNKLLEMYDKKYNTSEFSIEKQLLKLGLTDEQRQKVRTMIEENTRNT